MNIHINDKNLHDKLWLKTIFHVEVGSKLYGLKTEKSDSDILCIYNDPENHLLLGSIHHQLQYKDPETNTDYIYTTLPNFIRNIMTGDSTVNYEVLFTDELANSDLKFLYECRHWFRTYTVARAYLGFAKRDLKQSLQSNFDENKKLSHAHRGVTAAVMIKNGNYSNNYDLIDQTLSNALTSTSRDIKTGTYAAMSKDEVRDFLYSSMEETRAELNEMLEQKKIWRYFCPLRHRDLDNMVNLYLTSKPNSLDMSDVYKALEEGINYE